MTWRGNFPNCRNMPRQYSAMRSGIAASLALCNSMWTMPPSAVSPSRSARRFCTLGSSTFSHFLIVAPVNSRIVRAADRCNRSLRVTSYSCMRSSERSRHSEHVLGDVGENQVGRNRRHLVKARLAEFALHVVLRGETEAAVGLQTDVGRF